MEIADLLAAGMDEDERVAREASGVTIVGSVGRWAPSPGGDEWEANVSERGDEELLVALRPGLPRPADVISGRWGAIISTSADERGRDDASPVPAFMHAARHDPARVLREVIAKRELLNLASAMRELAPVMEAWFLLDMATSIEGALAAAYVGRPGNADSSLESAWHSER